MERELDDEIIFDNDYDDNLDPSEMISEHECDDCNLDCDHCECDDEPIDFEDNVQADADVLRNCGWGTDEDYGYPEDLL